MIETNPFYILYIVVGVIYFTLWAETLREQAGEDERVWFYLTLIVPFLWILYRAVKWR
jgi:hypothetical protein